MTTTTTTILSDADIAQYHELGYVVKLDLLGEADLESLYSAIDEMVEAAQASDSPESMMELEPEPVRVPAQEREPVPAREQAPEREPRQAEPSPARTPGVSSAQVDEKRSRIWPFVVKIHVVTVERPSVRLVDEQLPFGHPLLD